MAITAAEKYVAVLDKIYKKMACLSCIDASPAAIKASEVPGTFYVQKLTLDGLGAYNKTTGAPAGSLDISWTPFTYSQDRGRKFGLDALDAIDAMTQFGAVAPEFERVAVVPEIDAYRSAALVAGFGVDATGTLDTADKAVAALNLAYVTLANNEVDLNRLCLCITPTLASLVKNRARDAVNTDIFEKVETVVEMPQNRFYTGITLDDGSAEGEGGYAKATDAEDINFMLFDKGACFADTKHQALRIFSPNGEGGYPINQEANRWKFDFRLVHDCFVYDNRKAGGYVHTIAPA